MRILLLSDIHANLEALEAVLAAAAPYDVVVNLGDIVGYGASPNEVIERTRALNNVVIRGNHDRACAGATNMEDFNPLAGMAVLWTRTMLRQENIRWLRALPPGPATIPGLEGVQFVHGSPVDEDEYLLMLPEALRSLKDTQPPVTFFGHTHIQGGFMFANDDAATIKPVYQSKDAAERFDFPLDRTCHYLINPGSVGQPRDGDWRAGFATFDSDRWMVIYHRIPYDVKTAQQRIVDAQLPERLAARLGHGR